MRELAAELPEQIKVGTLQIEANQFTAEKFGVREVPLFLVFHNGQVVERRVGRLTKGGLKALVGPVENGRAPGGKEL